MPDDRDEVRDDVKWEQHVEGGSDRGDLRRAGLRRDADEVGVPRIMRREPRCEAARERVVAGAPGACDGESVRVEEVAQSEEGEHVHVLPRLERAVLACMEREGVPDRALRRDVRQREGLVAERERADVVPAREVLGADEDASARPEHAKGLVDEVIETLHVLDHLVGVDDVEGVVFERPAAVDVADTNVEAPIAREGGALRNDLEAGDLSRRDRETFANDLRPRAVVATDIERDRRRVRGRQSRKDLLAVRILGIGPELSHRSPKAHAWTIPGGACLARYHAPVQATEAVLLTVVVPVYNGGDDVVENVEVIRRCVTAGLPDETVELIVVSDGSIDGTAERLLEGRAERGIRVIHYDRNLGKGYAVKAGALVARGEWVALVDADLDLDPASIPVYVDHARRDGLDFAIGSKRHPASVVHYPRARRTASWCYQQMNRLLFRLDVEDTQVGLKVFSGRVADEVLPLLLVKRFAFDLELLAVAASLGYSRIRELPVRLEYRFSGSGVGSMAVLGALWDTAAIFYRLRILRTYERKRLLFHGGVPAPRELPLVSVVGDGGAAQLLDYPHLEADPAEPRGGLVALVARGSRPAGNWISAALPFFANPAVSAVVVPSVASTAGSLGSRVAAAVLESRLASGSRRSVYFPGNVRRVTDHPPGDVVVRRAEYLAAKRDGVDGDRVVSWLAEQGKTTVYTPDASVSASPPPLVRPHLLETVAHGRARGATARRTRGASLSGASGLSAASALAGCVGVALLIPGGAARDAGVVLLLAYGLALAASGAHAAARFHSVR